jgi:monofunctional biosynthetic peptidoglycan transglycosylase
MTRPVRRAARAALRWTLRLGVLLAAGTLGAVLLYRVVDPPLTPLMALRWVEAARAGRPRRVAHDPVPLRAVSPALVRAVIAAEDARFFGHGGVDWIEVERAREERRPRARGASTITMQCARTVFLWPGRSYVRKVLEVGVALLLEALWGKARILEVYLSAVEWGDGVYGAEAAARRWFGVPAARIGRAQAAALAAVLPNPRRWSPAAPTRHVARRAATIDRRADAVRLPPGVIAP